MSSSQIPALTLNELEQLFVLISDAQLTNHLAVASLALTLLEHISTLREEIELVWKSRWNLSSIFYIWIRYFGLIVFVPNLLMMLRPPQSDKTCRAFLLAQSVTSTTIVVSTDVILALRVWILFARPSRMIGFFVGLIVAEFAALLVVGVYTIRDLGVFIQIDPLHGCYTVIVPRTLAYYALPPFIVSSCMFAMTLYKCRDTAMSPGLIKTPVIQIFLRDGSYWFLAVLLLSLSELLIWHNARPSLAQIPIVPGTACIAIIGARVVLNIKNLARTNNGRDSSQTLTQTSVMWYHPRMPTRPKIETTPWYLRTN